MIRPAFLRTPAHPWRIPRSAIRWGLGLATVLVIAGPTLRGLPTARGQQLLHQRMSALVQNASALNVLGEVTEIGRSTNAVGQENQHMVAILRQMDAEESLNHVLENRLAESSRQLNGQLEDVSRLQQLTGTQIPLTRTIRDTTASLAGLMQTVQQSAQGEATTMGQVVTTSQSEERVMQQLHQTSDAILQDDLIPAVGITATMAGR